MNSQVAELRRLFLRRRELALRLDAINLSMDDAIKLPMGDAARREFFGLHRQIQDLDDQIEKASAGLG